jgi:hypothetical protein
MDSLKKGWSDDSNHYWGFIQDNDRLIRNHQDQFEDFYFWDMPYYGRYGVVDDHYWRVSKNGIHPTKVTSRPTDRFEKWNIDIKDWDKQGEEILVCPSSNTMSYWCTSQHERVWTQQTIAELSKHTDRPIRVRSKPRTEKTSGPVAQKELGLPSVQEDIQNAFAVVTSVSLVAVEAITNGIPVFCHPLSFASPISSVDISKIENPIYSDKRLEWLSHLAYCQFTEKETSNGIAYESWRTYV